MQVLVPGSDRCDQRLHELFPLETTAVAEANGWQRCPGLSGNSPLGHLQPQERAFQPDENNSAGWVWVATESAPETEST